MNRLFPRFGHNGALSHGNSNWFAYRFFGLFSSAARHSPRKSVASRIVRLLQMQEASGRNETLRRVSASKLSRSEH